ncbi:hypothetical protein CPB84DRAFT_1793983 [Gymnopilus junonius]|uniref:Uncharacterized protein n=1 Tax=Gymnopilus junonius TaxID=109634 RepID=A0A9P5NCU5_GYMJU|nr:hypothetical protein CPB84DRAFT_1793983 [Gymnopilus junonius]
MRQSGTIRFQLFLLPALLALTIWLLWFLTTGIIEEGYCKKGSKRSLYRLVDVLKTIFRQKAFQLRFDQAAM